MPDAEPSWQICPSNPPPADFIAGVKRCAPGVATQHTAQLLWQRGFQDLAQLPGLLDPHQYQPTSPFAFGAEMQQAVERLQTARTRGEVVAIWGDFDADGVTATAVLWEGLGQFFTQGETLRYFIPNRLTDSHGLSPGGIEQLHQHQVSLIVTCDTGSTNLVEIELAKRLGIDVIVTDHHTLLPHRPPVVALINPRYFAPDHPLATLSGVAVAYKLIEALYATLPQVPQQPLEELLDLVAIGLIADLVELRGDCRYLAQRGIQQLQRQSNPKTATRPGIAKLLEYCKRTGDRPMDIAFGLGPRINAVSRIQGDAHFCIELLTNQDAQRCARLAEETELANTRRKALQRDLIQQVTGRLTQIDQSTLPAIILADEQWPTGILGLVAGQIAQIYGKPTILLNITDGLACGSARSVNQIDLYQLVQTQAHLLEKFGGHPYAAGLALKVENLPLFTAAIHQQLRQTNAIAPPHLTIDLVVTVAELGKTLFQALKLLEPYGTGNPIPRLLVENCWFEQVWHQKLKDRRGQAIEYIKTRFELWDDTTTHGCKGHWWGHYKDEIPSGRCDAVVELDFNPEQRHYEIRLVAVRPREAASPAIATPLKDWIIDWRGDAVALASTDANVERVTQCPASWAELQAWFRKTYPLGKQLALAYPAPPLTPPEHVWTQLIGIAKYLSRTGQTITRHQLLNRLGVGDYALQQGFRVLELLGFQINTFDHALQLTGQTAPDVNERDFIWHVEHFLQAVKEEQFRRHYFYQVPLATVEWVAAQTLRAD